MMLMFVISHVDTNSLTCSCSSFVEKSLLVMENLFYGCDISDKFDLKGSERNRLVDPTNMNGEIVLLDENLVQSKCSKGQCHDSC